MFSNPTLYGNLKFGIACGVPTYCLKCRRFITSSEEYLVHHRIGNQQQERFHLACFIDSTATQFHRRCPVCKANLQGPTYFNPHEALDLVRMYVQYVTYNELRIEHEHRAITSLLNRFMQKLLEDITSTHDFPTAIPSIPCIQYVSQTFRQELQSSVSEAELTIAKDNNCKTAEVWLSAIQARLYNGWIDIKQAKTELCERLSVTQQDDIDSEIKVKEYVQRTIQDVWQRCRVRAESCEVDSNGLLQFQYFFDHTFQKFVVNLKKPGY